MMIRRAIIEDSAGLARVQVDSYRSAYADIFPPEYISQFSYKEQEGDWRELIASETEDLIFVAESPAGEIVGYTVARLKADLAPYDCELVSMHVRLTHQRQGIGRHLVRAVAAALWAQNCRSLMLWVLEANPSARRFYEGLGGRLLDTRKISNGAVEVAYGWSSIDDLIDRTSGGNKPPKDK